MTGTPSCIGRSNCPARRGLSWAHNFYNMRTSDAIAMEHYGVARTIVGAEGCAVADELPDIFGSVAVELGFLTTQQFEACKEALRQISSHGVKLTFSQICKQKRLLTPDQVKAVRIEMRKRGFLPKVGPYDIIAPVGHGGSERRFDLYLRRCGNAAVHGAGTVPFGEAGRQADKISLQFAVEALLDQASVQFDITESRRKAGDACRGWVRPDIRNKILSISADRASDSCRPHVRNQRRARVSEAQVNRFDLQRLLHKTMSL